MMRDLASILPLTIEGLRFEAGGRRLLDVEAAHVPKGGITAVIGPNGAGKSLFLRLCHGLMAPTSGQVQWALAGGRVAGRSRHAMVFQKPVMLRRSALANVTHALSAAGLPGAEAKARAEEALARFGLSAFAAQPARLMSGGEQQRLAIARAAALEPELLFLDEPTAALDPGATRQIEAMLAALAAAGMTLLLVTHDLGQVRRLAGRVLFMDRGRLVADQPTDDFFSKPAAPEAVAFIKGDLPW